MEYNIDSGAESAELEKVREQAKKNLLGLRNDYIDEIPESILQPRDSNYFQYKCRLNWFVMVRNELLKYRHIFSDGKQLLIHEFSNYLKKRGEYRLSDDGKISIRRKTRREDIDYANYMLDIFISDLS